MKTVLASNSPRRRELLSALGLKFTVRPSDAEEKIDFALPPEELVAACAAQKAKSVSAISAPDELIIAADTMVFLNGTVMGKPHDRGQAREMLKALSGNRHTVCTGVAVSLGGRTFCETESTDVYFRPIGDEEIEKYIDSGEPMDKAGAYGIQQLGSLFVEKVDGDYFNVVGLPLFRLFSMLDRYFGLDVYSLRDDGRGTVK